MSWLSGASLALAGIGTLLNVKGQMEAGDAEEKAAKAAQRSAESQAQLAEYNAAVADLQAKDALVRGDQAAQRFRVRTRQVIGEQRTQFAAGNIDVGYGSTVDVQADAAFIGELDALTITTNAAREAWGYRVEGDDLRKRAQIARREGDASVLAGRERASAARWGAAGSVLGFGASAFSTLESRYGFGKTTGAGTTTGTVRTPGYTTGLSSLPGTQLPLPGR